MNQESQPQLTMLDGTPPGNSGMLPLDLPEGVSQASSSQHFVHERDDTVEIYCARAADRMLPGDAFRAVLGSNVNNYNEQCQGCRNQCYG